MNSNMNPIEKAAEEIAENWNSAPVAGEEAEEFYAELHDPKTDARVLLGDQTRDPADLTDEQWDKVLERLRVLFPRPDKEDLPCCGCDTPVPEHEDFGNNSTIADTCCRACWDSHLKAEGMD